MTTHLLEVAINAEGYPLATLSPIKKNGEPEDGYRIAGPKAWGGSRNVASLKISDDDLLRYIKVYAPNVLKKLKE